MVRLAWMLVHAIKNELYEYKHLGVLKNYVNSFVNRFIFSAVSEIH